MRIAIYKRDGSYAGDIDEREVVSATTHTELNGEHSLTIVTTQVLEKGVRLLVLHSTQLASEYAVVGIDSEHACGRKTVGTYYCVWSIQEDLSSVLVSFMPGVRTPTPGWYALDTLLSTQTRWTRGETMIEVRSGASMYDMTAWDAIGVLLEKWGGELDVGIDFVSDRITGRRVLYKSRLGKTEAPTLGGPPRLDYGDEVSSIKRTLTDSPLICRISPRGKGEETEGGGYGRKIRITSVNDGKDYLEYAPMVDAARITNSDGTYIYPTAIVENPDCETPADLLAWAQDNLAAFCTPEAVYEVDVSYFKYQNVSLGLGDSVQVVDRSFAGEPLYLESRVIAIDRDLLNPRGTVYTIGATRETIAAKFSALSGAVASISDSASGIVSAYKTSSGVQVANRTNTNVVSLTLYEGIWMVSGQVGFAVNGDGRRAAKLSKVSGDTDNVISTVVQDAVTDGALTRCSTSRCFTITHAEVDAGTNVVYMIGYHSAGTTLACSGRIEAMRLN